LEQVLSFLFKNKRALFSRSQFAFGARPSVIVLVLLAGAAAGLLYYLYSRKAIRLETGWRSLLVGLRLALIALIAMCLMRPVAVISEVVPQSSYVAILTDNSSSMLIADDGGDSRLNRAKQLLSPEGRFATILSDKFKVRRFKFSDQAERVDDIRSLDGTGERTDVANSIEQVMREMSGARLTAMIVMSDGAQTTDSDFSNTISSLKSRGIRVFTVGAGSRPLNGDVELARATAPRRALYGSTVSAELLIRASGLQQKSVKVEVVEDGHALRSQEVPLQGGGAAEVGYVLITPSSPGFHTYTLTVKPFEGELITDNNSQSVVMEVEDSHPRVLYIEGEPRWEYGKIRQAMATEKNVVLVSILRSADGKYYRQGVENADDLAAGFPKSEEELFKYDALMLGSMEATFFSFDQLREVEQFVARRGGSLVVLGGFKAFDNGGYGSTPMADLLPLYLQGQGAASQIESFKAAPSERGREHPITRLTDQADTNAKAWEALPPITLPEILTTLKPGATAILEAQNIKEKGVKVPLLVEERYGRGRSFAFMATDTWRWRMMLESKNTSFETFWHNLLRYSVDGVRRQTEVYAERSFYGKGDKVRIRAEAADKNFNPITDAEVIAHIMTPSQGTIDVPLKRSVDGGFEGYAGELIANDEGLFKIDVAPKSADKKQDLPGARATFLVAPINREAYDAAQNEDLLKRIATETGGAYYAMDRAGNLVDDLIHSGGENSVKVSYDLWDMPVNFLLMVGIAAAEWFIRKRKGLA